MDVMKFMANVLMEVGEGELREQLMGIYTDELKKKKRCAQEWEDCKRTGNHEEDIFEMISEIKERSDKILEDI